MSRAIEKLLYEVFQAQGLRSPDRAAKRAAEEFRRAERDQKIYAMRAVRTEAETAEAFGISPVRVRQIVRQILQEHKKIA